MIQDKKYERHYLAEQGKVIVPKNRENNDNGSKSIWLSRFDNIKNYEEIDEILEETQEVDNG